MVKEYSAQSLGKVVFYTVPGSISIKQDELYLKAQHLKTPVWMLPEPIRKADAFRNATKSIIPSSKVMIIRVDEKVNDEHKIIRTFEKAEMREVDGDILKLDNAAKINPIYTHIATAIYDRATETLSTESSTICGDDLMDECHTQFKVLSEFYNGATIGRMTKQAIRRLCGISLRRSGGVEFVPQSRADELEALSDLLYAISPDCEVTTISMIPESLKEEQRNKEMLEKRLMDDIVNNMQSVGAKYFFQKYTDADKTMKEMVTEFSTLLKAPNISKGRAQAAISMFVNAKHIIKEYEQVLQIEMDELKNEISIIQQQAEQVLLRQGT